MSQQIPVLLDATSLPPNWGGVARYIEGLLSGLEEHGIALEVVAKPTDIARLRLAAPGHRYHAGPASLRSRPVRFAWEQAGLPRLAAKLGVHAIHSPHYTHPLLTRRSRIVTVHDATFFSEPEVHSRLKRTFFTFWTRRAARSAAALIAPSRATADAVATAVGIDAARIRVAYLGVDPEVFTPPADASVADFAQAHGLDGPAGWIAFLGTIEPRKNVPALLRAYAALRGERTARGKSTPVLVLSGSRGWDDEAARMLDALGAESGSGRTTGVVEAGYLPLGELSAFLGGSRLVAYPSLGEGFGLPVLEAMACGATVLTTDRLSIPEVGGEAVAYTQPDERSMTAALDALLGDDERRRALGAAALERSRAFTWAACAEVHLQVYAQAGGAA